MCSEMQQLETVFALSLVALYRDLRSRQRVAGEALEPTYFARRLDRPPSGARGEMIKVSRRGASHQLDRDLARPGGSAGHHFAGVGRFAGVPGRPSDTGGGRTAILATPKINGKQEEPPRLDPRFRAPFDRVSGTTPHRRAGRADGRRAAGLRARLLRGSWRAAEQAAVQIDSRPGRGGVVLFLRHHGRQAGEDGRDIHPPSGGVAKNLRGRCGSTRDAMRRAGARHGRGHVRRRLEGGQEALGGSGVLVTGHEADRHDVPVRDEAPGRELRKMMVADLATDIRVI